MKLYIIRHAAANSGLIDSKEGLSGKGVIQAETIAGVLKRQNVSAGQIWFSPKIRARETAEIIADKVCPSAILKEKTELMPNGDITKISKEIHQTDEDLIIVSHLPFVSNLASYLLAGDENSMNIEFSNCAVLCLEYASQWRILWHIRPEII